MQTLYSPNELAERWGYTPRTIRSMELDGKLHRLPDMPGVKYSAAEVHQLESIGLDAKALAPWERKKLEDENAELKRQLAEERKKNMMAQQVLRGGI